MTFRLFREDLEIVEVTVNRYKNVVPRRPCTYDQGSVHRSNGWIEIKLKKNIDNNNDINIINNNNNNNNK